MILIERFFDFLGRGALVERLASLYSARKAQPVSFYPRIILTPGIDYYSILE